MHRYGHSSTHWIQYDLKCKAINFEPLLRPACSVNVVNPCFMQGLWTLD